MSSKVRLEFDEQRHYRDSNRRLVALFLLCSVIVVFFIGFSRGILTSEEVRPVLNGGLQRYQKKCKYLVFGFGSVRDASDPETAYAAAEAKPCPSHYN